jgi:DNA replication licensing factor MCM7
MAQALARIHFRDQVEISDVDEALRLIKAAKSSLNDQSDRPNRDMSKMSHIYEIIRLMHDQQPRHDIAIDEIKNMVVARGFTEDDMWTTIREYVDYGVLFTTGNNTGVRFVIEDDDFVMDIDSDMDIDSA